MLSDMHQNLIDWSVGDAHLSKKIHQNQLVVSGDIVYRKLLHTHAHMHTHLQHYIITHTHTGITAGKKTSNFLNQTFLITYILVLFLDCIGSVS